MAVSGAFEERLTNLPPQTLGGLVWLYRVVKKMSKRRTRTTSRGCLRVTGKPVISTFHDISDDIPEAARYQRAGTCLRLADQLRETGRGPHADRSASHAHRHLE